MRLPEQYLCISHYIKIFSRLCQTFKEIKHKVSLKMKCLLYVAVCVLHLHCVTCAVNSIFHHCKIALDPQLHLTSWSLCLLLTFDLLC